MAHNPDSSGTRTKKSLMMEPLRSRGSSPRRGLLALFGWCHEDFEQAASAPQ